MLIKINCYFFLSSLPPNCKKKCFLLTMKKLQQSTSVVMNFLFLWTKFGWHVRIDLQAGASTQRDAAIYPFTFHLFFMHSFLHLSISTCSTSIHARFSPSCFQTMLELMNVDVVMPRFCSILMEMSSPRELTHYKTGFWGRAQVTFSFLRSPNFVSPFHPVS